MRTIKIDCFTNNVWLMSVNLWICDIDHRDTVYYQLSNVKPTQRQIRKFMKSARKYFRHGTRAEQAERMGEINRLINNKAP